MHSDILIEALVSLMPATNYSQSKGNGELTNSSRTLVDMIGKCVLVTVICNTSKNLCLQTYLHK